MSQKLTKARSDQVITTLMAARLAVAVLAIATQISPAHAAGTDIFDKSCSMLWSLKKWLFGVVYVLGAIGMVLIAVSAFLGKFKFAHLISLGGGLFIVAMSDALIGWLVSSGTDSRGECTAGGSSVET
ncbi:TrbC/VirB2 family protein [Loktanella sp. DJP18]|uniref:TrbC/VirB2 family protein n=1 Tax=Loktanella sp. DJP18 TaxID=3409788 RepID=UPI003BB49EA3